jgi:hypothetical protein
MRSTVPVFWVTGIVFHKRTLESSFRNPTLRACVSTEFSLLLDQVLLPVWPVSSPGTCVAVGICVGSVWTAMPVCGCTCVLVHACHSPPSRKRVCAGWQGLCRVAMLDHWLLCGRAQVLLSHSVESAAAPLQRLDHLTFGGQQCVC